MAKTGKIRILYGEGDAQAQSAPAAAFEKAGHVTGPVAARLTTIDDLTTYATSQGITLTPKIKPAR